MDEFGKNSPISGNVFVPSKSKEMGYNVSEKTIFKNKNEIQESTENLG